MARLTRTQKYAELRERMAHDSESSFSNPSLGKYEDKLTELDNLFKMANNPTPQPEEVKDIDFDVLGLLGDIELKKEVPQEVKSVEEVDTIEKISQDKVEKVLSIEQMVENMVSEVENEIRKIRPVEAKPIYPLVDETPASNIPSSVEEKVSDVESVIENLFNETRPKVVEETFEELPVQEEIVVLEETPVQEVETQEEPAIEEVVSQEEVAEEPVAQEENITLEENEIIEEPKVEVETEEVKEEVVVNVPVYENEFDGVNDRSASIISLMDESMKPETIQEVEEVVQEIPEEKTEVEETLTIEEPVIVEEKQNDFVVEEPTLEIASEDLKDIDELLNDNFKDIDNLLNEMLPESDFEIQNDEEILITLPEIEEVKEEVVEETPITEEIETVEESPVVEEVQEKEEEVSVLDEEPEEEVIINNNFIDEALEEVKEYNLDKGNQTMETISDALIDQVRHNDVEIPFEDEEENDVSNTISLELDKVLSSMNEIKTEEIDVDDLLEETPAVQEETKAVNIAELEEEKEEHRAIAQTLEEDVVEIKSLDETLKLQSAQVVTNVLDDTVPFDISGEEEYEDDVPSKTLNIILGVLIAVLLLVLCVIIYYILVARGILG